MDAYFFMEPVACPRPKVTKTGRVYYPANYLAHKALLVMALRKQSCSQVISEGAAEVVIQFVHPRPKSCPKKWMKAAWALGERVFKATRPDIDNLSKTVLDAISDAELWGDDGCVARLVLEDYYAADDEDPHIHVVVRPLPLVDPVAARRLEKMLDKGENL